VLATIYETAPLMGPAYWIPAFWVPALLVTHYVTFILLFRPWPQRGVMQKALGRRDQSAA